MKKTFIIFALLILTIIVRAQIPKIISITSAGTLSTLLTSDEKTTVTNLTVTGSIDARDIKCMRDEITKLSVLDLSSATIQAYTGINGTSEMTSYSSNELPSTSFWNVKTSMAKTSLQTIILPNGLISIGDHAFQSCIGLKTISFPSTLTTISSFAFISCSNINDVLFPSSLKHLSMGAFAHCIGINKLHLPNSLATIDLNAFYDCVGIKELSLPLSLSSLGSSAFENCSGITGNVIIPEGLTRIEDNTFMNCQLIDSITLPSNLSSIGYLAFKDCKGLKTIFSNNTVPPYLGQSNCFTGANAITDVYVPSILAYQANTDWMFYFPGNIIKKNSSVEDVVPVTINVATAGSLSTLVGDQINIVKDLTLTGSLNGSDFKTIRDMANLTILNMADANIVSGGGCYWPIEGSLYYTTNNVIGFALFNGLINLTSITLPKNIVSIRDDAFMGCNKLTTITIPDSVKTIDRHVFYNCTGLDSISIPENVDSIGSSVFANCTRLRVITIPNNNLSIGERAFEHCTGLKKIYCKTIVPPTIDFYTFDELDKSQCTLFVPEGTLQTYKSAWFWLEFNITDGTISSVNNQNLSDIRVHVDKSSLIINGANYGDIVTVYSASGSLISRKKGTDSNIKIDLPVNNLYLVKIANRTFKVVL